MPSVLIPSHAGDFEMAKLDVLKSISFGERIAEDETAFLSSYFVQTDQWQRIFRGEVDVVYGPKGSGKSAIYSVLLDKSGDLFDRGILLAPAENPRGAAAFAGLVDDPPTSEEEFRALWKIYFLVLIGSIFRDYDISNAPAKELLSALEGASLLPRGKNLAAYLKAALDYVREYLLPQSFEAGVDVDPITGLVKGFKGKIALREPGEKARKAGLTSVDSLLENANDALSAKDIKLWLILDRLDVAFAENTDLEENALRALFKTYRDLAVFDRISLKIFLRTDIWKRITREGFREASHITKTVTISWNEQSLMNLIIRRALKNEAIQQYYDVDVEEILSDQEKQRELFYRIFPEAVAGTVKKLRTFEWMVSRIQDGLGNKAPRELIHLLSSAREIEVSKLENGEPEPPNGLLIDRAAIKAALVPVSQTRLEQTIFAEYPQFREPLLKLKGEKSQQSVETLAHKWGLSPEAALETANALEAIGFFVRREKKGVVEFWVPFLYRNGLDMSWGAAYTLPATSSKEEAEDEDEDEGEGELPFEDEV
jgi:hypothetical protein